MYESPVWEHSREAKLIYKRNASVCRCGVATIALVPQESSWNSNRTLEPSVSLGLQRGSSSLVLSGSTEGQVTPGVVTTVTTPPAEHTDRAHTHTCVGLQSLQSSRTFTRRPAHPSCPGF